jgi:hypothetical protein
MLNPAQILIALATGHSAALVVLKAPGKNGNRATERALPTANVIQTRKRHAVPEQCKVRKKFAADDTYQRRRRAPP